MTEPLNAPIQLNLGERARNAGRDYHEGKIPDSIRVYLATTPSDVLDDAAIDNERLFYYRFSIDAPQVVREQVIAIKKKFLLTDAECRWLRRSGQMKVRRSGVTLKPSQRATLVGWFYVGMLCIFCCYGLLVIGMSNVAAWKQVLGVAVVVSLVWGGLWLTDRLFIAPWRWLCKS